MTLPLLTPEGARLVEHLVAEGYALLPLTRCAICDCCFVAAGPHICHALSDTYEAETHQPRPTPTRPTAA